MTKLEKLLEDNTNKDFYLEQFGLIKEYFTQHKYSGQVLDKTYFPAFIANGLTDDLLDRCLRLREIKYALTKEKMVLLYGDIEGNKKWDAYRERQSLTNKKEYKMEVHGFTESDWIAYNKNRAATKDNMIRRHGHEEGARRWKIYRDKQKFAGSSLQYFIEKYGKKKGKEEWDRICKAKAQSLENLIERYGEMDGTIRFERICANKTGFFSKVSQVLFWRIYDEVLTDAERESCHFGELNKEFGSIAPDGTYYMYDFVVSDLNLVIEFNGNVFHGNPDMYTEDDTPNPFDRAITVKEMWEKDKKKKKVIEDRGFVLHYVWENKEDWSEILRIIYDARKHVRLGNKGSGRD